MTTTVALQIDTEEHPAKPSDWTRSLPKMSAQEVRLRNQTALFADGSASDEVIELIESVLKDSMGDQLPDFSVRRGRSSVLGSQFVDSAHTQNHFGFGFDPSANDKPSYCFVETGFIKRLIDLAAGGTGSISTSSPGLTPVEKTIAEIVSREIVERLFISRSGLEFSPDRFGTAGSNELLLFDQELTISIGHIHGNARVLINSAVFDIFASRHTPQLTMSIPISVLIGDSELFFQEIDHLESGDIVLLTNVKTHLTLECTPESMTCLVGDAENIIVECRRDPDNCWEIISIKHQTQMKEIQAAISINDSSQSNQQTNTLLDSVCIKLRIQLPVTNFTGRQLMDFHPGRILQLDFNPTDTVEVRVSSNSSLIATGKLIEIDGKLGVRIESVLNRSAVDNQNDDNSQQIIKV